MKVPKKSFQKLDEMFKQELTQIISGLRGGQAAPKKAEEMWEGFKWFTNPISFTIDFDFVIAIPCAVNSKQNYPPLSFRPRPTLHFSASLSAPTIRKGRIFEE